MNIILAVIWIILTAWFVFLSAWGSFQAFITIQTKIRWEAPIKSSDYMWAVLYIVSAYVIHSVKTIILAAQ